MWWIFIFLLFIALQARNPGFPFCFWLATKALCLGSPGAVKREETNGVSLGNKSPIALPQEFQGFGACCGSNSSPCLHYASFWIDIWVITIEIIQPGFYCCYLCSWFLFKMAVMPLLAHKEDSYSLSSRTPEEKKGKKRVIINLMQI